jgi:hypothetical protein
MSWMCSPWSSGRRIPSSAPVSGESLPATWNGKGITESG